MLSSWTPLSDTDLSDDIIEHVNNDHSDELSAIASVHSDLPFDSVTLKSLYNEGCIIAAIENNGIVHEIPVSFTIKGDIEEKVLYIAYDAMVKQGKPLTNFKRQFFQVIDCVNLTDNIFRLHIQSAQEINAKNPDFSYFFSLKKLQNIDLDTPPKEKNSNKPLINRIFLTALKWMSSTQRQSVLRSMNKSNRYYTVRKCWYRKEYHHAYVDIYHHGQSHGGKWVKSLQPGDIIHSLNEYPGNMDVEPEGQMILIADETGFPAVAHALERWASPTLPHIITISQDNRDQGYFDDLKGKYSKRHMLISQENLVEAVSEILSTFQAVDMVWGALEKEHAKHLRSYVRNHMGIRGKSNRITAYWQHMD